MRAITVAASALLVLATAASVVSAQCGKVTFSNGTSADLSAFKGTFSGSLNQGPSPYTGAYDFLMAPCTTLTQCTAKAGQVAQKGGSDPCNLVMAWKSSPAADISGKHIVAKYTGTDPTNGYTWNADLMMNCGKDAGFGVAADYTVTVSGTTIEATFQTYSSSFCIGSSGGGTTTVAPGSNSGNNTGNTTNTGGDEGGLTWGGVFLMCFFIPLGIYFIAFTAWNYHQGLRGVELVPHRDFWGSLPGLFADGCKFTWSKIRGQPFESSASGASASSTGAEGGAATGAGGYTTV